MKSFDEHGDLNSLLRKFNQNLSPKRTVLLMDGVHTILFGPLPFM